MLDISRSGLYYQPAGISEEDLTLMKLIDRQYPATPFYGARKIAAWLKHQGYTVNRKRVRRLMRIMGLKAIYRRPRTSQPAPGHKLLPVPFDRDEDNAVKSGMGVRYHLHPHGEGIPVSGGHHRRIQPVCALLASVKHPGRRLLAQQNLSRKDVR